MSKVYYTKEEVSKIKQARLLEDRGVTHYEGCYDSGPKHYECALLKIKQLVEPMMEFKTPTKVFGPNLEQVLNAAGFYRKKEWVGLTEEEKAYSNRNYAGKCAEAWQGGVEWAEAKLKEKNGG